MTMNLGSPRFQAFDNNGGFLSGGKLYSYIAGTNTPKDTYTDATGTITNTNPIVLDGRGEADVWLSGTYKLVLKDPNDNVIWTVDNVGLGGGDVSSIAALRALGVPASAVHVNLLGYYADGDGGGGQFYWDSAGTEPDDDGMTILPSGYLGIGRWKRNLNGTPVTPKMFGAFGNGVADDTTAIQATIDYSASVHGSVVTGGGKTYAVSSQVNIAGTYEIVLEDINLKAIPGTWPTGTGGAVIKLLRPSASDSLRSRLTRIVIDCDNQAKSGLYVYRAGAGTTVTHVRTMNFSEYGFWLAATGDGNNDVKITECAASEVAWGVEPKFSTYSQRTGVGFFIDGSADLELTGCTAALCRHGLRIREIWNGVFSACKFWNGPVRTDSSSVTVLIESTANRVQFNGCRFDDGAVKLYNFNHQFIGCQFIQFGYGLVQLVATSAGETTGGKLTMVGNVIEDSSVSLLAEGAGTWGGVVCEFIGNRKSDGTDVTIQDCSFVSGNARQRSSRWQIGNISNAALPTGYNLSLGIVHHGTAANAGIGAGRWSSDTTGPTLDVFKSRGANVGEYGAVLGGDDLGVLAFSGATGATSADVSRGATIRAEAAGNWGGSRPTRMVFSTVSTNTAPVDRLVIDPLGHTYPANDVSYQLGTSTARWSQIYGSEFRPGDGTAKWLTGAGSPEGVVSAAVGSMYTRTDGSFNTTLYVKESGIGNTGWVAK